jgi:hypothetical protein
VTPPEKHIFDDKNRLRGRLTALVLFALTVAVFWIRSDVILNLARSIFEPSLRESSAGSVSREVYFSARRNVAVVFHLVDDGARKIRDTAVGNGGGWLYQDFKRVARAPSGARVIFLSGSGSYHHHTAMFISERSPKPSVLYLIDAHPDARPSGRLDCGSWVNYFDGGIVFLGGYFGLTKETMRWLSPELLTSGRLDVYAAPSAARSWGYVKAAVSTAAAFRATARNATAAFRPDRVAGFFGKPGAWVRWKSTADFGATPPPAVKDGGAACAHLSIDLDVLAAEHLHTGWGNGTLEPRELTSLIAAIFRRRPAPTSADICGWSGDGEVPAAYRQTALRLIELMSSSRPNG